MGIGIIGASSGAAEALPFGAGALLSSGFVNGTTYDYTASVAPGRYIIEGATADGRSPIIAYAPNSDTTAIAYPGKSAVLNVTTAETVIKLSSIPLEANYIYQGIGVGNDGWYKNTDSARSTDGSKIVMAANYFDGGTWYSNIYGSDDSGVNWTNTIGVNGVQNWPRAVKFIPENGGYFLAAPGDNFIWRTTTAAGGWSQRQNLGSIYDVFNDNGTIYVASQNGVYRSTDNGLSYTAVYSGQAVLGITKIEETGQFIGFNNNRRILWSNNGTSWSMVSYTNNVYSYSGAGTFSFGIGRLKTSAVIGFDTFVDNQLVGSGFSIIGRQGRIKGTSYTGRIAQKSTSGNYDGPSITAVVSNQENRGFVLAISAQSGEVSLSTDGFSWNSIGYLPGLTNINANSGNVQNPKLEGGVLTTPMQFPGAIASFSGKFAYKLYESAV